MDADLFSKGTLVLGHSESAFSEEPFTKKIHQTPVYHELGQHLWSI